MIEKEFSLGAHQKIYHLGDRHIKELFDDEVIIQEKIDGSQFGFAKFNNDLHFRSKGKVLYDEDTTPSFGKIILWLKHIKEDIPDNMCFYGEYLERPRQNALRYDRTPKNHLVLFAARHINEDIWVDSQIELERLGNLMGFEVAPLLKQGKIIDPDKLLELLDTDSFLGGEKIEGFVVKNYHKEYQFANMTIPFLAGKYVREDFKEKNHSNQNKNFNSKGKLEELKDELRTEARWLKAVQYQRDIGELTNTPKDIGALIKRINLDIVGEEEDYIKCMLYSIYKKEIIRYATRGLAEWYKEKLLNEQFEGESEK